MGTIRLQLDADRPVEVFYPADPKKVPGDATGYRYTAEEVFGSLAAIVPPDVFPPLDVPGAWRDVPVSTGGVFPLVVMSHGFGVMRFSYSQHAAHLASWGYVVALPEHPSRDLQSRLSSGSLSWESDATTVLDTIDLLTSENSRSGGTLEGRVAVDKVAVEGHSAGGHDAALAAEDPRVDTWIGIAPAVPFPEELSGEVEAERADGYDPGEFDLDGYLTQTPPVDKPSMMLVAENDRALRIDDRRTVFDWLLPPKRFVVLADTGHAVFIDDCERVQARGGGQGYADALGLAPDSRELRDIEDGCLPEDAPVESVWATWHHLTVAQLNWVFDIDGEEAAASLEADHLEATFPGSIAEYVVAP